jgi:D-3-phosphoglycerate dehydrogenase
VVFNSVLLVSFILYCSIADSIILMLASQTPLSALLVDALYTPHLGASTEEANHNVSLGVAELIEKALNGEVVAGVNMPPVKTDNLNGIKPYVELGEILGKIYYQAEKATAHKIEVIYSGDLAGKDTKLISLSVLKGFLEHSGKDTVNYVNAGYIAKNMGIEIVESKSSNLDKYTNLITVKISSKGRDLSISGTVFAKEEIRIVDFFGYKLDFEPTPYVIAIQNIDKPGIIGKIGTILGGNNINIAAMQWSRNRKAHNKAVAFVSVDCEVEESILQQLREIDGVLKVTMLIL